MKIAPLLLSLFGLLVTTLPSSAFAADIAFFPVETSNVNPADATAIGELLAQSYASVSAQSVLAPSRIGNDPRPYQERAAALGVKEFVRTDAVAAGFRIVIHSVRYRADGTGIYQTKMVAERADDLINVSDRMARALYNRVDDEEMRTRENVTLSEARAQNRVWTEKVIGFKTGLHVPLASGADYATSLSLNFDMRLETGKFFLEFGAGFMIPSDGGDDCYDYDVEQGCGRENTGRIGGLAAEIGGSYFLTDGNVAPYVSLGVIPRLKLSGDELTQLVPFAGIGLTVPRDSSMRFYTDARVGQSVTAVKLDNNTETHPTELMLHVGIGW